MTLAGNKVYAFGSLASAEFGKVFHTKTQRWKRLSSRPILHRLNHAAALADDKIYLYGGRPRNDPAGFLQEMVEYDIVEDVYNVVSTSSAGPGFLSSMSAVFAEYTREILVFGGCVLDLDAYPAAQLSNRTHAFKVDSQSWREVPSRGPVPEPRKHHGACILGRKMYIYGGRQGLRERCDLWIADLSNMAWLTWSVVLQMPMPLVSNCSLDSFNGHLILYGGVGVEDTANAGLNVYFTQDRSWRSESSQQVTVQGRCPRVLGRQTNVKLHDSLLYFTADGVFLLSQAE